MLRVLPLLAVLVLVAAASCGREPRVPFDDPLHAHGIRLPPQDPGLPPKAAAPEPQVFPVPPPPFTPGIFPCSRCHEGGEPVVDARAFMPDPNGNTLEAVEAMVKDDVPAMGYAVAWDDAGKTNAAYMQAAGQGGIPCSFVVDGNGKIAYIGHPVTLDYVLPRLAAGTWDPAKGAAELGAALRKGGEIFGMDRAIALQKLPAFEKEHPEVAVAFETAKFQLLLLAGKTEASALGMKLLEKGVKHRNPMLLNQVAWFIVDPEADVPNRDLDLAMKAAEKAVELSKGDAAIVDTLARVHYLKGDLKKAIELQTKAVEKAEGEMLMSLQETLEQYRAEAAEKAGKKE